ncbi:hypothetical protein P885DRAFT_58010 [Corynascus similis CBS 632.67]
MFEILNRMPQDHCMHTSAPRRLDGTGVGGCGNADPWTWASPFASRLVDNVWTQEGGSPADGTSRRAGPGRDGVDQRMTYMGPRKRVRYTAFGVNGGEADSPNPEVMTKATSRDLRLHLLHEREGAAWCWVDSCKSSLKQPGGVGGGWFGCSFGGHAQPSVSEQQMLQLSPDFLELDGELARASHVALASHGATLRLIETAV